MENRYKINYDFKSKVITHIDFQQGDTDSSVLEVQILDGGVSVDITGETIEFRFLKPDNTKVYQDTNSGVSVLEASTGKIECILKNNTLAVSGTLICEVCRMKSGKSLTGPSFEIIVNTSVESGIESTNYIGSIEAELSELQALNALCNLVEDKTPLNASDTGEKGTICKDANYLYICTDTNTWKRITLSTW